jgi:hypothetical protein
MVLDALPTSQRRELHGMLARRLEDAGASVFLRAAHAFEADEEGHSLPLLLAAAEQASRAGDHETAALVHYRRAAHVARWHLLLSDDDPRQLGLSLDMADALIVAGHLASAEVVLKAAVSAGTLDGGTLARAEGALARIEHARTEAAGRIARRPADGSPS